ncbi:hypothetical protein TIFTF001_015659 [Ficus carica]|uniref:Uncharacterized protein n=1 Tax=Ficus carica TaxID=3494 RepID=A0AA88D6R7_FICCA|nr:hypothetical protein TIFTF001_015659 [Ficus carica]
MWLPLCVGFGGEFGREREREREGGGERVKSGWLLVSSLIWPFSPSQELLASYLSPSRLAVSRGRLAIATTGDGTAPTRESIRMAIVMVMATRRHQ